MGQSQSAEEVREKEREEAEEFVFKTTYISWDEKGNLRYGMVHPVRRNQQKLEILQLDYMDNEEDKLWYVIDTAWINSWLAYVHFDKANAPAPGPCSNRRLITYDYVAKKWVGRFGLFMAMKEKLGDYRRVSPEVWAKFQAWYPGSGPSITMRYNSKEINDAGLMENIADNWTILDPPPAPEDAENKFITTKRRLLLTGHLPFGSGHRDRNAAMGNLDGGNAGAGNAGDAAESKLDDSSNSSANKNEDRRGLLTGMINPRERDSDDDSDNNDQRPSIAGSNTGNNRAGSSGGGGTASPLASGEMLRANNTKMEPRTMGLQGNTSAVYNKVREESKDDDDLAKRDDSFFEKVFIAK